MQMRVAEAQHNVRVCAGVCGEIFACLTESSLAQPSRGSGLGLGLGPGNGLRVRICITHCLHTLHFGQNFVKFASNTFVAAAAKKCCLL